MNLLTFIPDLITGGMQWVKGRQDRKMVKLSSELAIAEATTQAKIKRLEAGDLQAATWENTALENAGIKDEVMMTVILAPMVMCFFPGGAEVVSEGFEAMNRSLPGYWEYAFYATIGISYGIRKLSDFKTFTKAG